MLEEYRDVLLRPELDLHTDRRRQILDTFETLSLHVAPAEALKISRHESDNRIYECAAEAFADFIVTGNLKHFTRPYRTTRIITARQLVETLASDPDLSP